MPGPAGLEKNGGRRKGTSAPARLLGCSEASSYHGRRDASARVFAGHGQLAGFL